MYLNEQIKHSSHRNQIKIQVNEKILGYCDNAIVQVRQNSNINSSSHG